MAARPDSPAFETIDLRFVPPGSLDRILEEESDVWRTELAWDFTTSAGLVKRFADMQSLPGVALMAGPWVIGYTYTVTEEEKGLIGDLYILREYSSPALEDQLLRATVESLTKSSKVRRMESQIILLSHPRPEPPAMHQHLHLFERCFMSCDLENGGPWMPSGGDRDLEIGQWHEQHQDDSAGLIAHCYEGHIDSQINDQYRSLGGARRFLNNIVQYPGCGAFHSTGSWLGWQKSTGRLCAMSLSSLVAADTGHITQICVLPNCRGTGVGREMLARTLEGMRQEGVKQVSLTVTASNTEAIGLYESMGFRIRRRFAAMVWDGFREPRRYFV